MVYFNKNKFINTLIFTVVLLLIIILIRHTPWYNAANNIFYDNLLLLNVSKQPSNNIVIVDIDDKSIEELGRWPWSRDQHIKLIEKLSLQKAKAIGFDIRFINSETKQEDNKFISALKKQDVVLIDASHASLNPIRSTFWEKIKNNITIGHSVFKIDEDGVLRKQCYLLNKTPSFALAILNKFNPQAYNYDINKDTGVINHKNIANINNKQFLINFKSPESLFKRYSYSDVLDNKIPEDAFKNKIVLVGLTAQGLTNDFITAFSKHINFNASTNSIFINAQIIDSLLNYKPIKDFNNAWLFIPLLLYIFIVLFYIRPLSIIKQAILLFIVIPIIVILLTSTVFCLYFIWISPVLFLLASVLIFLLISTLQILTTYNILDKYISDLSGKKVSIINDSSNDPLKERISTIKDLISLIEKDKDLFETVLSSVNSTILLFNSEGSILYSNNPFYARKGATIADVSDQISIEDIHDFIVNKGSYQKNLTFENKHYKMISNYAKDNLYAAILNNITESVKTAELKSNILHLLTHEIKTPVATILLSSDFIQTINNNETTERHLNKIADQAIFIKDLINNFLALNKLDAPELCLEFAEFDLIKLIKTTIDNLLMIAEAKNLNIELKIDDKTSQMIVASKEYLSITIKNLLENAIKYSPENTTVIIKVKQENNNFIISIKDQGYGIPEDELGKLFDKFYRGTSEKTKNISGTGLGLSFVEKIISLHNGKIEVFSKLNEGSEFIITLPLSYEDKNEKQYDIRP